MIFVESHIDRRLAGLEENGSAAILRWVTPFATCFETRTCRQRGVIRLNQAFLLYIDASGMVRDEADMCLGYKIGAEEALAKICEAEHTRPPLTPVRDIIEAAVGLPKSMVSEEGRPEAVSILLSAASRGCFRPNENGSGLWVRHDNGGARYRVPSELADPFDLIRRVREATRPY